MRGCFSPSVRLPVESRLIFPCLASNRRVQPGDHSSQARRGEHRLCQCLLHRCECRSSQYKCAFVKSHVCRSFSTVAYRFSLCTSLPVRHRLAGLPSEGLLHGEPGPAAAHHRGLLEDDLGVEKLLHRHAHRAGGERAGMRMNYKYYLLFLPGITRS